MTPQKLANIRRTNTAGHLGKGIIADLLAHIAELESTRLVRQGHLMSRSELEVIRRDHARSAHRSCEGGYAEMFHRLLAHIQALDERIAGQDEILNRTVRINGYCGPLFGLRAKCYPAANEKRS